MRQKSVSTAGTPEKVVRDIRRATHKQYSVEVFWTTLTDRSLSRTTGFQALRNILPWSPAEARSSTAPLECYDIVNGRW